MQVFVDASAYIASLNRKDSNHAKALTISGKLFEKDAEFVTSNIVLYEVYTVLAKKVDKNIVIRFRQKIIEDATPIIYMVEGQEDEAWRIFVEEKSKNVGFFDCTSFAIIKSFQIKSVFSFDNDFKRFCNRENIGFNEAPNE